MYEPYTGRFANFDTHHIDVCINHTQVDSPMFDINHIDVCMSHIQVDSPIWIRKYGAFTPSAETIAEASDILRSLSARRMVCMYVCMYVCM